MKEIKYVSRKTGKLEIENPPGESYLRFLYHHPFGRLPLNLLVKRKFLSEFYGRLMKSSNSRKKIRPFIKEFNINMNESLRPVEDFLSFNDFFCRKLKPEARPVQDGLVSPADGKIIAFENNDEINSFYVKGRRFTLNEFLQDNELAERFGKSSLFIIRLAPNDYHRFHFPYTGKVSKPKKIFGQYCSVSPYAVSVQFTKVFCENRREYTILKTKDKDDLLIAPVGATMIGSIIETYQPETEVAKGDEMGYFAFGGSSILMLVNKNSVKIDDDILENTKKGLETTVNFGEKIGK